MIKFNHPSFLVRISALILIIATKIPIKVNAIVIIIKGLNMLGSIEGVESLLMLAG
jgi:hypothetical protein